MYARQGVTRLSVGLLATTLALVATVVPVDSYAGTGRTDEALRVNAIAAAPDTSDNGKAGKALAATPAPQKDGAAPAASASNSGSADTKAATSSAPASNSTSASRGATSTNASPLSTTSFDSPAYRLDRTVVPSRYELTIKPSFDTMTFQGELRVLVNVAKPTKQITLHSKELSIISAKIKQANKVLTATVQTHPASDTITLTVDKPLKALKTELLFTYQGKIGNGAEGLHGEIIQGEKYAVTELEPDGARMVLPCFDEPAFKSTFLVTMVLDRNLEAVSNGRKRSEKIDAATNLKTVQFEDSPLMSTYLLTLAFGDLTSSQKTTSNGTPVAVWSLKSKQDLQAYSLNTMAELLPLIERQFGISYPYPKLELITIPQYAGAMENAAAMIFDDMALVDPARTSPRALRGLSEVIAHEMAHQWFGDLVTTAWWDDLWLNEAFATWMATRIIDEWKPEWQAGLDDVIQVRNGVLERDALASTHAIRSQVLTSEDAANKFDDITYGKGALVLTMLESYLGDEIFWAGIRRYLEVHRESVATANDLWISLEASAARPIKSIAGTWFDQPGYPILDVSTTCENGKSVLSLKQQRFMVNPPPDAKNTQLWTIPIPVRVQSPDGSRIEWRTMDGQSARLIMDGGNPEGKPTVCNPVFPNANQLGFYRMRFTPETLQSLLVNGGSHLEVAERSGLLSDQTALLISGALDPVQWLNMFSSFSKEHSRHVLETMFSQFGRVMRYLPEGAGARASRKYGQSLAQPYFTRLGWEPRAGEPEEDTLLRPLILRAMVSRDNVLLRKEARARLMKTLDNPQANPMDTSVFYTLVGMASYEGDSALFDRYVKEWKERTNPREKSAFMMALLGFKDPALMEKVLQLGLSDEAKGWQRVALIAGPLWSEESIQPRWDWIKGNFDTLKARLTPDQLSGLIHSTGNFCTPELRADAVAFYEQHKADFEEDRESMNEALESIDQCIHLRSQLQAPIENWLLARYPEARMTPSR